MTEDDVKKLIAESQRNARYNTTNASFHTHNGIDSPKLESGKTSTIVGRSHGPTTTSIPINHDSVPQLLNFATNDFAVGITWDATGYGFVVTTAGYYLVGGQASTSVGGLGAEESRYFMVYKNGSEVLRFEATTGAANGAWPGGSDLLNLAIGDEITFYVMKSGNDTCTVGGNGFITMQ